MSCENKLLFLFFTLSFLNSITAQVNDINCQWDEHHQTFVDAPEHNLSEDDTPEDDIVNASFYPYVINSEDDIFSLHFEVSNPEIEEIQIHWCFNGGDFLKNGSAWDSLILKDDGLLSDEISNDLIFTTGDLSVDGFSPNFPPYSYTLSVCTYKFIYADGTSETITPEFRIYLRAIGSQYDEVPQLITISDSMQYASHVVNIVDGDFEITGSKAKIARKYYDHFPDDRELLMITSTNSLLNSSFGGSFSGIQNNTIGLTESNSIFNNSSVYGSDGKLEGIITFAGANERNSSIVIHELNHRWSAKMSSALMLREGSHYRTGLELIGSGFGGAGIEEIVQETGNLYTYVRPTGLSGNYFTPLELYLAGMASFESIPFPIRMLINPDYVGTDANGFHQYNSTAGFFEVTEELYLQNMSLREPDFTNSKKHFKSSLIIVSKRLLTANEMMYCNFIMKEHEKNGEESIFFPRTFNAATNGQGTLETKLPVFTTANVEQSKLDLKVFPNPTRDKVFVISELSGSMPFELSNTLGEIVMQGKLENGMGLDLSNLSNGCYLLFIEKNGTTFTEKIIKN